MSKNVFELRTVQGACIRSLVEVLKEILTDVNMLVMPPNPQEGYAGGIKLMVMNMSNVALIHLQLDGDKFEVFRCEENLVLGINMMHLFKLVKGVGNNDVLTLFVSRSNKNVLGINVKNTDKRIDTTYHLKLMDIDDERISVPDAEIEQMVLMPSLDFQRMMRDMSGIGNRVVFSVKGGRMSLTCRGDFADQVTHICTESGDDDPMADEPAIEAEFDLKFLNTFAKSQSLCPTVELYMRQNYPLILLYNVANLGKLRFALAPQVSVP